jgi:hypothetical protein
LCFEYQKNLEVKQKLFLWSFSRKNYIKQLNWNIKSKKLIVAKKVPPSVNKKLIDIAAIVGNLNRKMCR